MKRVMLFILMILCVGVTQALVINVDYDARSVGTAHDGDGRTGTLFSGQGAYADPGNDYWTSIVRNGSATNLLASDGITETGVDVTTSGGDGYEDDAKTNYLLSDYFYNANTTTITGLEPNYEYLVYVYACGDQDGQGSTITINEGTPQDTTNAGNPDYYALGINYVIFDAVAADATGQMVIVTSGGTKINGFQIIDPVGRGAAHTPSPERLELVEMDSFSNLLTWESPETVVPADVNLVSVQQYDIIYYVKDNDQVDPYDPNWAAYGTFDTNVTSPYDISALNLDVDQTVFWRVDTHVTWDSNEITGTPSVSEIVTGANWQFTTQTNLPVFMTQPVDQAVLEGETAEFAVEVLDKGVACTFQWFDQNTDAVVIGGDVSVTSTDTTSMLAIANVAPEDANSFYCVATNIYGSTDSDSAALTVKYMLAYWPFDSDLQSVVAGSPAVSVEGDVTIVAGGVVGNCADFAGADDWLQTTVEDSAYFDPMNSAMTVMLWVYSENGGRYEPWVSRWGESGQGWQLRLNNYDNWPQFSTRGTNGNDDDPRNGDITLNIEDNWHHIVGVTDGVTGIKRIYVDGVLYASGTGYTGTIPTDTNPPLGISCRIRGDNGTVEYNDYPMQLDEIKLFNYALTSQEIADIYLADTGLDYVCSPEVEGFSYDYDTNNDCKVDLLDFALLAGSWLECARYPDTFCD